MYTLAASALAALVFKLKVPPVSNRAINMIQSSQQKIEAPKLKEEEVAGLGDLTRGAIPRRLIWKISVVKVNLVTIPR